MHARTIRGRTYTQHTTHSSAQNVLSGAPSLCSAFALPCLAGLPVVCARSCRAVREANVLLLLSPVCVSSGKCFRSFQYWYLICIYVVSFSNMFDYWVAWSYGCFFYVLRGMRCNYLLFSSHTHTHTRTYGTIDRGWYFKAPLNACSSADPRVPFIRSCNGQKAAHSRHLV